MESLFTESYINGLLLKNRFIRAATWEGLATLKGAVTQKLIDKMVALAKGGVGLIISSHLYISEGGQGTPWQIGIYEDDFVDGLKKLTEKVHTNGGKIISQLAHAGQYALTELTKQPALTVSYVPNLHNSSFKMVSKEDIKQIVSLYAKASKRGKSAGFDGIELHFAHGYFLSQFLSPAYNKREDEYGGSIQNRTRIHCEIIEAIRKTVGADFPLFIKMNCADFIENGLEIEDSIKAAKIFEKMGVDAIEVSGGIIRTGKLAPSRTGINSKEKEAYFRNYCQKIKAGVNIPVIIVGGIKTLDTAKKIIIDDKIADYISMSRALIREPNLINRWEKGDKTEAKCKFDNLCFNPGFEGKGVYCVTKEIENKKISASQVNSDYS